MAQIYQNQLMHKSTDSKPFKVDPLKDYISDGLKNLATASDNALQAINRVKDEQMAGDMAAAAKQSAKIIDEWQDFSNANSLELLEQKAMKPWYDALKTADGPTQTRFLRNNPESEEIFRLTVSQSVVKRAQDQVFKTRMLEIPKKASEAVAMYDPIAVRNSVDPEKTSLAMISAAVKRMTDHVNYVQNESMMDLVSMKTYLMNYQEEVGKGLVETLIGADDYKGAEAANAHFAGIFTPEQMAKYDRAIDTLMKALTKPEGSGSGSGSTSLSAIQSEYVDALASAASRIQQNINLNDQQKRERINGLFTMAKDGKITLEKMEYYKDAFGESLANYMGGEVANSLGALDEDVKNEIVKLAFDKFSYENTFMTGEDGILGRLKMDAADIIYEVQDKNIEEWDADTMAHATRYVKNAENFVSYDSSLREVSAPVVAAVKSSIKGAADYLDAFSMDYKTKPQTFWYSGFTKSYTDKNPRLVLEETISNQAMSLARNGEPMDLYDENLMQNVSDMAAPLIRMVNGGSDSVKEGSYKQGIAYVGALLYSASAEEKQKLGIANVSAEQIAKAVKYLEAEKNGLGLSDSLVDEDNLLAPAYRTPRSGHYGSGTEALVARGAIDKAQEEIDKYNKITERLKSGELTGAAAAAKHREILDNGNIALDKNGRPYAPVLQAAIAQASLGKQIESSNYLTLVYEVLQEINPAVSPDEESAKNIASVARQVTFNSDLFNGTAGFYQEEPRRLSGTQMAEQAWGRKVKRKIAVPSWAKTED